MIDIGHDTTLTLRSDVEVIPLEDETVLLRSPSQGVRIAVEGVKGPVLAAMLGGCDGTQSVGSLVGASQPVERFLPLLRGLVDREILRCETAAADLSAPARYFAQFHGDPLACWNRLLESTVLLCGDGPLAEAAGGALEAAGIRRVRRMLRMPDDHDRESIARACLAADLVVVASVGAESEWETMLGPLATERGFPWLPTRLFGGEGFVGPLFVAGEGPCYDCFCDREAANWADPQLTRRYLDRIARFPASHEAYGRLSAFAALLAHWAALEATAYLARYTVPALIGNVLRVGFASYDVRLHRVLRVPRCPSCSTLAHRPSVDTLAYAEVP